MYVLNNSMAFFPFTKAEKKVDFMAQRDWLMKRLEISLRFSHQGDRL